MNNYEIIECSKAILDFLQEEQTNMITFNTPMLTRMNNILNKYGYWMIDFALFVNKKLNIYNEPLWNRSAREFFSEQKSRDFFKYIINYLTSLERNKKLNKIFINEV